MTDELSGRALGRYQVLERLGRGGMAEVYRAYQPSLDRYVAIKVIYPHLASEASLRERFGREARAVAALHHPNIVQVHDFDVQGDTAFMAMEFISGPTLKAALTSLSRRGQLLPLPVVGRIVGQLADALGYAHEQQVVHRDVKPANVLLRRRDQRRDGREGAATPPAPTDDEIDQLLLTLGPAGVVLTDFGVARVVNDSVEQTAAGTILGSPAYMSPEQGRGERAGPASDIYSLGVVLYELVTGRVPFDADTPFAIVVKHIQTPLPPPRSFRPDLPEALERVMLKALAKEPGDRFQDAAAFGAAAREACGASEGPTLKLQPAAAPGADPDAPAEATRFIEELHATRLGTPAPATLAARPPASTDTTAARPAASQPPPVAAVPPQGRPKGRGRWLLGCLLALAAVAVLVLIAFAAGGALVFRGLGQVGALTVPTQYQAEVTAAALQGTTIPYLEPAAPAATALPAPVVTALDAARAACGGPGCPGGSASTAVATLDAAIAATPASAELYAARAITYLWWDPYTYAEQIDADVGAALERDPGSALAFLARGGLAMTRDDRDAAMEAFNQAVELAPGMAEAYLARALLLETAPDYYEEGSPSRAQLIADATAALAIAPESVEALMLRGNAYYNSNEPEAAAADYSAILALKPDASGARLMRARAYRYALARPELALADYDALLAAEPENVEALRERFSLRVEQGQLEAAQPDADAVVRLLPAEPAALTMRGFLALALGRPADAAPDFERALLIAGAGDLAARYGRGKVLLEQGDAAAALPDIEAAAAAPEKLPDQLQLYFRGHPILFLDLARAYGELGRTDEQLAALERAIETEGGWYMPYLLRGRVRAANGDSAGAREDLRRALETAREDREREEVEDALRQLP